MTNTNNCPRCNKPLSDNNFYGPCPPCRTALNQLYSTENNFKTQRAAKRAAKKRAKEQAND